MIIIIACNIYILIKIVKKFTIIIVLLYKNKINTHHPSCDHLVPPSSFVIKAVSIIKQRQERVNEGTVLLKINNNVTLLYIYNSYYIFGCLPP
jgi:hypothetical protein